MVIEAGYYEADRFSGYCLHSDSSSMRTIGPYHKGESTLTQARKMASLYSILEHKLMYQDTLMTNAQVPWK